MKHFIKAFALLLPLGLSIFFLTCSREEIITNSPPVIQSTKGAYILSEGGFSPGSSKLSLYSVTKDSFYLNIFSGGLLGLFPDGLILFNNFLYLTEQGNFNGPGKLHKLDTTGAVILTSQPFGRNPYSLTIANNKIYVTNGPESNVSVLDINFLTGVKTIGVGAYPQEILSFGNKVFVCNTSVFNGAKDSTVSVIDAISDNVVASITVKMNPSSLAITKDNKLLIGCADSLNRAYIYLTDPNTYVKLDSFLIPEGFDKDITVDKNTNDIYFISYLNDIVKLNLTTKSTSTVLYFNPPAFIYGYGFDYVNKKHYILDAINFTVDGKLYIYNVNGSIEKTFVAGIAPRRVVFKF